MGGRSNLAIAPGGTGLVDWYHDWLPPYRSNVTSNPRWRSDRSVRCASCNVLASNGAATPLLYPVTPFIWAIIVLQLITGLVDALGWVGAQTLVSRVMKGDTTYTGRMSFCTRLGLLIGPAVSGVAWDYLGPWGGFGLIGLWSTGILFSLLLLPFDFD